MSETEKLVMKAKKGDRESLAQLIKSIKEILYKTAFTYLKNRDGALDAFSETSYRICERINSLKKPEAFKSWAMSILVNICREQIRKNKNVVFLSNEDMPSDEYETDDSSIMSIDIARALDSLCKKHREVLILRYYSDLEVKEIARILGISEGTVKSRIHYALKKLDGYFKKMEVVI